MLAESAAAGGLDDKHVVGVDIGFSAPWQIGSGAVWMVDPLAAGFAGRPARQTEGREGSAGGDDEGLHRFQETHAPDGAVAALVAASAT